MKAIADATNYNANLNLPVRNHICDGKVNIISYTRENNTSLHPCTIDLESGELQYGYEQSAYFESTNMKKACTPYGTTPET